MDSEQLNSDSELIAHAAALLDELGPFTPDAPRRDRWRTTEQLAYDLERDGRKVDLDRLDKILRQYEVSRRERMKNGLPPDAEIRRATYLDRTTALPLWGSTKHHGQPWPGQPPPDRRDPPDDIPSALRVPDSAPQVFLSHAHEDVCRIIPLAEALAAIGIGSWTYETHIDYLEDIAECVKSAIACSSCCILLLTRTSIASLWVTTELDTALAVGRPVVLVVDSTDRLLLDLLKSVRFQHPDEPIDLSVEYDKNAVRQLHVDYRRRQNSATRAERYRVRVHEFIATLPSYLCGRPALAFPDVPSDWSGPIGLRHLQDLPGRLEDNHGKPC